MTKYLLPAFRWILGLLFLVSGARAFAFEYVLESNVPLAQRPMLTQFFEKAKQTLPAKIKKYIPEVHVRFEKLTNSRGSIRGVTYGNTITLTNNLLLEIEKGSDAALGTILHETVHVYDNLNIHTAEELSWIQRCKAPLALGKTEIPKGCELYAKMNTSFSGNPYFLQVAGWNSQGENTLRARSENPYELTNPQETLAVNMDLFLTDAQYKCRRPGLYKILSFYFEHVPFQDVRCDQGLGFATENSFHSLDPNRVYQIHYMLADKDQAMIRLVVCAPETTMGPECLKDLSQHIVLRGAKALPLSRVLDGAIKKDLHNVWSLPLKLSKSEIREVVLRAVETHWFSTEKKSTPKPVKDNGASEALTLLKSSLLKPEIMALETQIPLQLYDFLVRIGLGDPSVFTNREEAQKQGYSFELVAPSVLPSAVESKSKTTVPLKSANPSLFLVKGKGYGLPSVEELRF